MAVRRARGRQSPRKTGSGYRGADGRAGAGPAIPDVPNKLLEMQYASGRYYTLIYSASGAVQRERGYATLAEATQAFEDMRIAVIDGSLDPSQPVFRQDLED